VRIVIELRSEHRRLFGELRCCPRERRAFAGYLGSALRFTSRRTIGFKFSKALPLGYAVALADMDRREHTPVHRLNDLRPQTGYYLTRGLNRMVDLEQRGKACQNTQRCDHQPKNWNPSAPRRCFGHDAASARLDPVSVPCVC
jgi:hypothetical protein